MRFETIETTFAIILFIFHFDLIKGDVDVRSRDILTTCRICASIRIRTCRSRTFDCESMLHMLNKTKFSHDERLTYRTNNREVWKLLIRHSVSFSQKKKKKKIVLCCLERVDEILARDGSFCKSIITIMMINNFRFVALVELSDVDRMTVIKIQLNLLFNKKNCVR